ESIVAWRADNADGWGSAHDCRLEPHGNHLLEYPRQSSTGQRILPDHVAGAGSYGCDHSDDCAVQPAPSYSRSILGGAELGGRAWESTAEKELAYSRVSRSGCRLPVMAMDFCRRFGCGVGFYFQGAGLLAA